MGEIFLLIKFFLGHSMMFRGNFENLRSRAFRCTYQGIPFQLSSSVLRRVMRGKNSKNKKILTKTAFLEFCVGEMKMKSQNFPKRTSEAPTKST